MWQRGHVMPCGQSSFSRYTRACSSVVKLARILSSVSSFSVLFFDCMTHLRTRPSLYQVHTPELIDAHPHGANSVAFKTDPLLTKEVFLEFQKIVSNSPLPDRHRSDEGELVFSSQPDPGGGFRAFVEKSLTNAETEVKKNEDAKEKARTELLEEVRKKYGFSVE